jgi:hypothetical protein
MPTPEYIARAWHSVTDRWVVRRNKEHDERQWEVVHDWGGDVIDDDTMATIGRYSTQERAEQRARKEEDKARGPAVLRALSISRPSRNEVEAH